MDNFVILLKLHVIVGLLQIFIFLWFDPNLLYYYLLIICITNILNADLFCL